MSMQYIYGINMKLINDALIISYEHIKAQRIHIKVCGLAQYLVHLNCFKNRWKKNITRQEIWQSGSENSI